MPENDHGLAEKDAVISLITSLFIATDRKDWATVKSCFADSVLFDMTSMTGGKASWIPPAELIAGWKRGLTPIQAVHHQTGNFQIKLDGSRADAFCYGIAYHYLPNRTGRHTRVYVGSYDISLIRNGARWRIDRFKFNLKFMDGNAHLEKYARR